MGRPTLPSPQSIHAWARLMRVSRQLVEQVESTLKAKSLPPLSWYDALHEIAEAGPNGLRPFELVERMLLAQYNVSRLLMRLEAEGLINKLDAAEDGRGQTVQITSKGRELRRRMWDVYGPAIKRLLESKLSDTEVSVLSDILGKLRSPPASG